MKTFKTFILEELDEYQKREVHGWGFTKTSDMAHKLSDHVFGSSDRLVLPVEHHPIESRIPHHVKLALKSKGIENVDYEKGLGKDKYGRDVKITKHLEPSDLKDYLEHRQTKGDHEIVISRHPYDIAGMSTNRGWVSCMNMSGGSNREYLPDEIKQGTHVAYLVNKGDHKIKNPLARIALKPFETIADNKIHTILRPEGRVYSASNRYAHDDFEHSIKKWSEKTFPDLPNRIYKKHEDVYNDSNRYHEPSSVNLKDPNVPIETLNHYSRNGTYDQNMDIINHPKVNHIHMENIIRTNGVANHVNAIIQKPELHPNVISAIMDQCGSPEKNNLLNHHPVDINLKERALNYSKRFPSTTNKYEDLKEWVSTLKNSIHKDLDNFLKKPKLSQEEAHHILKHGNIDHIEKLINHPAISKIDHDHLESGQINLVVNYLKNHPDHERAKSLFKKLESLK